MYKKTRGEQVSPSLAHRSNKTRGTTCRLPVTTFGDKGVKDPHLNPNFEVRHQDEPTTAHPVSQHKNLAGMQHDNPIKGKHG